GLASPALKVMPGRKPGGPQVLPPLPERAKPMSVAPPLKKRPTWKAPITVLPAAKVSGSTSVACWLVEFANRCRLTCASARLASAAPTGAATTASTATTAPADDFQYLTVSPLSGGDRLDVSKGRTGTAQPSSLFPLLGHPARPAEAAASSAAPLRLDV